MIENLPEELKGVPQWICHQKKVPKNPLTGRNLAKGLEKWGTSFDVACQAVDKYGFDGLGFVFKRTDDYCGIDLDKCVIEGDINPKAKRIIELCDSYTEYSPSRTGVHIIVKNTDKSKVLLKTAGIEAYSEDRYFTVSGFGINGDKVRPVNVPRILQLYVTEPTTTKEINGELLTPAQIRELVEKAEASGNGDKFKQLWSGDWKEEYDSHSEADMALCNILAFWLNTVEQIDQIFRMSKMFRAKWDRSVGQGKTYGQMTIEKVMLHKENVKVTSSLVMELDDFMVLKMPEIKMIMSPWLSYGSTHMVYAPRGAGKTFFSMSIGLAAAHGTDFGEWEMKESVNVMYVDGEMLPQHMQKRANSLKCNLNGKEKNWYILSSGLNLQNGGSAINIAKTYWQDYISQEVKTKDIKLLFLDNIAALTPGIEENESSSWDIIASWFVKVKQTGCAIILVHHAGKGGQQRGTSAREDALDTVIALKPNTSDSTVGVDVDIIFEKSRHIAGSAVASLNFKLKSDPGSNDVYWDIGSPGVSKRNSAIRMMVEGKPYREIAEAVGVSKSMLTKYKEFAITKGWIEVHNDSLRLTKLGGSILNDADKTNEF